MRSRFLILIVIFLLDCTSIPADPKYDVLFEMNLEDLMNVEVISASNLQETILQAPAMIIVITREDLVARGWNNLLEMLSSLPGMDIIITYGDTPFYNYWRGYRNDMGAPYLLMIDGIEQNHLYYNMTSVLVTFPLSNIDRIEIVYGPASSVFGANAFNGLINIITKKPGESLHELTSSLIYGSNDNVVADINYLTDREPVKFSISARLENKNNLPETHNEFEYTASKYLTDRSIWGGFLDNPRTSGVESPVKHRAIDIRCFISDFELGMQYFQMITGYGLVYPFDRSQPNCLWYETDLNVFGRFSRNVSKCLKLNILLRYRQSNVPNKSYTVEAYQAEDEGGNSFYGPTLEYWQVLNSGWSIRQDLSYNNESLSAVAGMVFNEKNLQKAYDYVSGPLLPPGELDLEDYDYPDPPDAEYNYVNRIITRDLGLFLQAKYQLNHLTSANVGIRVDDNSSYGSSVNFRTGLIRRISHFYIKLLYGEAHQEPSPRMLYGGWVGTGSDPDLVPERSRTLELCLTYLLKNLNLTASAYYNKNYDTVNLFSGGARNYGEREIYGLDCFVKYRTKLIPDNEFWLNYSYIHTWGKEKYDPETDNYSDGAIGDIAPHKLHFGMTQKFGKRFVCSFTGHWISERKTVYTNPMDKVNSYSCFDLFLRIENVLREGVSLKFKVSNLLDEVYFHPGIRDADSGNEPGFFEDGVWHGSRGWYNSLIAQPARETSITLTVKL